MDIVINLDKPKGITSQQAVLKVKKVSGTRKAGHAGTLDPIATGVLLVCLGEATKVTRFLSDLDKEYIAVVKLGEKTDTYDSEGEVIQKVESLSLDRADIEKVLPQFTGTLEQIPPMYSAVKVDGKPLYKLARKGITIDRPKRTVTVNMIEIMEFSLPFLEMKISCSKGTYIRTLCDDIGTSLGVGAHIAELRRTHIGNFSAEDSVTMDDFEKVFLRVTSDVGSDLPKETSIASIDAALGHLRELSLGDSEFFKARNGLPLKCLGLSFSPDEYIKLKDPSGKLFAIGKAINGAIKIERMLHLSSR